ncbi:MAG: PucC family protein [Gemmatimonadaceae bacterium]|nr:PucC family protein [Gemmatimonadaceae bacterium]
MNRISRKVLSAWASQGSRLLPFADVATPDLPLARLLRLSLFQISVGMASVLLVGTLNRVMIVELRVPASIVAIMISLPLLAAPFRALIGFRSDTHTSALGWRRVPYIWNGTMLQFGGFAIMPFAILVVSGRNAVGAPDWIGQVGAGLAFLLVGAGLHTVQTAGLALATDLVAEDSQPRVVGLMYVMLLVGMIASAIVFGWLLTDFSPGRLIQVVQGAAVATIILNVIAMWKQEARDPNKTREGRVEPSFAESWSSFIAGDGAIRRLIAVGIGTMAFSMQDVLLEPYGGQVLGLTVANTTRLTATLSSGGLLGFLLASRLLGRGGDPFRMSCSGALAGIPGFAFVIMAAPMHSGLLFFAGTFLIGFGGGLLSHGTLTATMQNAPEAQRGLALGAWGAVQASAAGLAVAFGGVARDVMNGLQSRSVLGFSLDGPATAYTFVYSLEIVLLVVALVAMAPLIRRAPHAVTA